MLKKEKVLEMIKGLPDIFSAEELIDRILLLKRIETGLNQVAKGELVSDEELEERLAEEEGEGPFLTDEQIQELAEDLEMGFRCYIHKETKDIRCFPDDRQFLDADLEAWEEDRQAIKKARGQYLEIEKMTSQDEFRIMEEFAGQVDHKALRERLQQILSRPKPFRNFKAELEDSGPYREKWFDFRRIKMRAWVINQLSPSSHLLDE
jgi:hypothetical protein